GSAILMVVLLLVGLFGSMKIPIISKLSFLQMLLIMGILFAAFSMLVISIATTLMIQRPLGRLMRAIHRAESGDLRTRAKVESPDEIGQVATQFNEMLRKINGLEQTRLHAEHQLTAAREELRYKSLLEEKAAIITSTNRRLEQSLKELSVLYNISQSLTSSIDPEELCNKLSQVISKNLEIDDFAILLVNDENKLLEVKAACGFRKNSKIRELDFEWGEGITGQVAKSRKPVYIPDTSHDEEYLHYKGIKPENGSFYSVPIMTKENILGVINFSRRDIDAFSAQEMRMLAVIAGQVSIALENARLYAKTKELSLIDELTQVFNRRHFHKILENEIKRAKRFRRPLSLLMLDVDHFKKFNDSFGHLEGDKLLVDLANVLKGNLREIDTVARYGGEEFAIILPNTDLGDGEKVGLKVNRIIREMSQARHKTKTRKVTVSVGVSSFPSDAESMDDLINHADIALYKGKARGRDQVVAFLEKKGRTSLRVVE
ncbi:MAG: diguanylate cyclase, partial [bacterium]|nr:diguanylate cyclase [bacterium]